MLNGSCCCGERLRFELDRTKFIRLVSIGKVIEAVGFAREHLSKYKDKYEYDGDMKHVVSLLALQTNAQALKQATENMYIRVKEAFLDCCFELYQIDDTSLLDICIRAGKIALPR